jgi:hypothetical protein
VEKIPFQTVQNSIDQVCNISEESELERASEHLFEVQPYLAGFFIEFIEDMSEGAQDLGFMMALIVHRAFETQYPNLRVMTDDEVIAAFERQESALEGYAQMNEEMLADIQKNAVTQGQPEVLNYILEELFMTQDADPELDSNEQAQLFIVCKFLADCLHELAEETSSALKH